MCMYKRRGVVFYLEFMCGRTLITGETSLLKNQEHRIWPNLATLVVLASYRLGHDVVIRLCLDWSITTSSLIYTQRWIVWILGLGNQSRKHVTSVVTSKYVPTYLCYNRCYMACCAVSTSLLADSRRKFQAAERVLLQLCDAWHFLRHGSKNCEIEDVWQVVVPVYT